MANYCPSCGVEVKPSAVFCPNCGSKVNQAPAPSGLRYSPPLRTPVPPPKRSKKPLIAAVVAVVAVVIVAAAALGGGNNASVNDDDVDQVPQDQDVIDQGAQDTNTTSPGSQDTNTTSPSPQDNNGADNSSQGSQGQDVGEAIIRIVEVEANPAGTDSGHEWITIKNQGNASVDITGWSIRTSSGRIELNALSGTLEAGQSRTITFPSQFLDNENEVVRLLDKNGNEVDRTPSITDTDNNSWTWVRPGT